MEVHHSPLHGKKRIKEYISEFIMIFLAVTAGFFAETLREHMGDAKKEKEYMVSMISDLKEDTGQIRQVTSLLFKNIKGQDSLIILLKTFRDVDSINIKAYRYYLRYTIGVPQVVFNDRTITQLLGSGNMRLITNHAISDSIMDYTTIVKYDKMQAEYYNDQFKKCFDYSTNLFDFTVSRNPLKEDFKPTYTTAPEIKNIPLISQDPLQIKKYCNELTMLQSIINGYIMNLAYTKIKSERLITLITKKYNITE